MCCRCLSDTITLSYGDRERYVKGLSELLTRPTLTMELEFSRDIDWTDWKGVRYCLQDEWRYVNGPAVPKHGCTPGYRDENNDGKTPDDFLKIVNDHIRHRRAAGYGVALLLEDAQASLDVLVASSAARCNQPVSWQDRAGRFRRRAA